MFIMKKKSNKLFIYQYNKDFELVNIYESISSAAMEVQISNTSIYKSIIGERNLAGGYFWYRGNSQLKAIPQKWIDFIQGKNCAGAQSKSIVQIDLNGNAVAEYSSIRKAAKTLNVFERGISLAANGKLKTAYGFRWKLKNKSDK